MKFWHESGTIECIRSRVKRLVFHGFRGDRSELAFLKFFFESALVLKEVLIVLAPGFTSIEEVHSRLVKPPQCWLLAILILKEITFRASREDQTFLFVTLLKS
jgi:hypothetical protein